MGMGLARRTGGRSCEEFFLRHENRYCVEQIRLGGRGVLGILNFFSLLFSKNEYYII